MSVLKKIFGSSSAESAVERLARLEPPSPGKPSFASAISDKVSVEFYTHQEVEGAPGNFLTAVTNGLLSKKQRELVLTLCLEEAEDPLPKMKDLVRFVASVYAWAREGNLVDAGGFTQFGERGLFGQAQSGLLYTDARPIADVSLHERALAAIFVSAEEVRTAREYGTYRVLTRMGLQLRVFPFPVWGDLRRESAVGSRESESLLGKYPRIPAPGVHFVMVKNSLRVTIPSDALTLLRALRSLPAGSPFVFLTRPAADANAILTWSPGQQEMSGISQDGSDGSRMSGSSLLIVPSGQSDQIRPFEDGYSLLFSADTGAQVAAALGARRSLTLKMAGDAKLELAWASA